MNKNDIQAFLTPGLNKLAVENHYILEYGELTEFFNIVDDLADLIKNNHYYEIEMRFREFMKIRRGKKMSTELGKLQNAVDDLSLVILKLFPDYIEIATIEPKTFEETIAEQTHRIWEMITILNKKRSKT
jgi:hypothetical protein